MPPLVERRSVGVFIHVISVLDFEKREVWVILGLVSREAVEPAHSVAPGMRERHDAVAAATIRREWSCFRLKG